MANDLFDYYKLDKQLIKSLLTTFYNNAKLYLMKISEIWMAIRSNEILIQVN